MDRKPVNSSNLVSVGYDSKTLTLEVEFHSGNVYKYQPVTEHAYKEMMNADSMGAFFHQHIKNNADITAEKVD